MICDRRRREESQQNAENGGESSEGVVLDMRSDAPKWKGDKTGNVSRQPIQNP